MTIPTSTTNSDDAQHDIAARFVKARLEGHPIPAYPHAMPSSMAEAYAIQDKAIALWPAKLVGWKVGGLSQQDAAIHGTDRLVGPVFDNKRYYATSRSTEMKILPGGFAAVEAEIVIIVAHDAPNGKTNWNTQDAQGMVGDIHAGVEIASSPFAAINQHGPLVTISDFGNNFGLIIGDKIPVHNFDFSSVQVTTLVEDKIVGTGTPLSLTGGPVESFRALLEITSKRGLYLKKGMAITTGALTGIHEVESGQSSIIQYQYENSTQIQCHYCSHSL